MRQSRLMSLVEAVANVMVGYAVAVVTQLLVFPMFGLAKTILSADATGAQRPPAPNPTELSSRKIPAAIRQAGWAATPSGEWSP